jgi:hypothetical protein
MKFKSDKSMVVQHLGLIAGQQHNAWKIRNPTGQRSVFQKPLEFEAWLLKGMNYHNEKYGTEFETVQPGLMRIRTKDGKSFLRTIEDFQREHEEYKVNFYL